MSDGAQSPQAHAETQILTLSRRCSAHLVDMAKTPLPNLLPVIPAVQLCAVDPQRRYGCENLGVHRYFDSCGRLCLREGPRDGNSKYRAAAAACTARVSDEHEGRQSVY